MSDEHAPTPATVGNPSETLSNEVLKLKVDDLFQEVENLKRRVERLEDRAEEPKAPVARGVVSEPDRR